MEQYKTCTKCGQTKPNSQYSKSKLGKYGTRSKCKPCTAKQTAEYRKANPNYSAESSRKYRIANPEKAAKAAENWRIKNPDYAKKYHADHYQTERLRNKKYYEKNRDKEALRKQLQRRSDPESFRERNKRYAANNRAILNAKAARRRAIKASATTYVVSKKEIWHLYNSKCVYCQNPSTTMDHVMPLNRGGNHGIGNLAPCCGPCNFSKRDRTVMEWRIWKKRLGL